MQPRVVRQVCKPESAKKLLPVFERVMEIGTAKGANILGLRIAGKTGTTKVSENGRYIEGKYRASFVGLFPADNPQVAMVVVLGEPAAGFYGGDVAAPVFSNIAKRWIGLFPEVSRKMSPPVRTVVNRSRVIPNVVGLPGTVAANRLAALGIVSEFMGGLDQNMPVKSQNPQAGTALNPQTAVQLEIHSKVNNTFRMPDVRGLSSRQALAWLSARSVQVRLKGQGIIRTQIPKPGHPLPNHAILSAQ
jgi:cell division protein FtsI (penicillin-binding protein 3)